MGVKFVDERTPPGDGIVSGLDHLGGAAVETALRFHRGGGELLRSGRTPVGRVDVVCGAEHREIGEQLEVGFGGELLRSGRTPVGRVDVVCGAEHREIGEQLEVGFGGEQRPRPHRRSRRCPRGDVGGDTFAVRRHQFLAGVEVGTPLGKIVYRFRDGG
ncbi:hypothetical protein [Rhodococcus sp. 077-4]|uniref:hypothetical protein n=1 Tax=Rhodococcus sp. 077-4 TaxID=2789271 RepID=UPI0039F63345